MHANHNRIRDPFNYQRIEGITATHRLNWQSQNITIATLSSRIQHATQIREWFL